jgi:hypothetical protein
MRGNLSVTVTADTHLFYYLVQEFPFRPDLFRRQPPLHFRTVPGMDSGSITLRAS